MRLLDLFCGAGGAALGYSRVGFEIVGVDIDPQPNYPFRFIQGDALNPPVRFEDFDLLHASPPCQRFSSATRIPQDWPDLVADTRALLDDSRVPYIIENVPGAPLRRDVLLCGSMVGLEVQRHRVFELGGWSSLSAGGCNHKAWKEGRPWTITGHLHSTAQRHAHSIKPAQRDMAALMGMPPGMPVRAYTEAIPPAYTEYLGRQFLDQLAKA